METTTEEIHSTYLPPAFDWGRNAYFTAIQVLRTALPD